MLSTVRDDAGRHVQEELHHAQRAADDGAVRLEGIHHQHLADGGVRRAASRRRPAAPDGFVGRSLPHFPRGSLEPAAKGFVANSFFTGMRPRSSSSTPWRAARARRHRREDGGDRVHVAPADEGAGGPLAALRRDGAQQSGGIVQLSYGDDGLEPTEMEGADGSNPVEFPRLLSQRNRIVAAPNAAATLSASTSSRCSRSTGTRSASRRSRRPAPAGEVRQAPRAGSRRCSPRTPPSRDSQLLQQSSKFEQHVRAFVEKLIDQHARLEGASPPAKGAAKPAASSPPSPPPSQPLCRPSPPRVVREGIERLEAARRAVVLDASSEEAPPRRQARRSSRARRRPSGPSRSRRGRNSGESPYRAGGHLHQCWYREHQRRQRCLASCAQARASAMDVMEAEALGDRARA